MRQVFMTAAVLALVAAGPDADASLVTYTWVTESSTGAVPTSATFQVELSTVQSGVIEASDIQNILYEFPGAGPLEYGVAGPIGQATTFVDTATGLPIPIGHGQGFEIIGIEAVDVGDGFLYTTFGNYSDGIIVDYFLGGVLGGVQSSGSGRWEVSGYPAVPEPTSLLLASLGGLSLLGVLPRRKRA